jgi:hypothetical protein
MMHFFVLAILFLSLSASAGIELVFPESRLKQGSLQEARLLIDEQTARKIELHKIKGQTIDEILYFYSISPLLYREGKFQADAVIIFVKVPSNNLLIYKAPSGDIQIKWDNIVVDPTESPKDLVFLDFHAPAATKIMLWVFAIFALLLMIFFSQRFFKKWKLKKNKKLHKIKMKNEIYEVKSYEMVVSIWQKKRELIQEFSHLERPFEVLEETLFKFQFKPYQTELEKKQVMTAWQAFLDSSRGGFDGI